MLYKSLFRKKYNEVKFKFELTNRRYLKGASKLFEQFQPEAELLRGANVGSNPPPLMFLKSIYVLKIYVIL
jgi:hypothetical protein